MKANFVRDRLSTLELGREDVAVIAIRPTKADEVVQVVFAQHVERTGRVNLNGEAMKGYKGFDSSNLRPFWVNFTLPNLKQHFPDLVAPAKKCQEENDYVAVDKMNPTMYGSPVCIQLTETLRASKSDMNNIEQNAKQTGGAESQYLLHQGCAIFVRESLTYKDVCEHTFIQHDSMSSDIADLEIRMASPTEETKNADKAQKASKEIVDDEESDSDSDKVEA